MNSGNNNAFDLGSRTRRFRLVGDDPEVERLTVECDKLRYDLSMERSRRKDAEERLAELSEQLREMESAQTKRRRKKKEEAPREYSEFKSDGKRKARPADSIRSYEDFVAIQDYYLSRGRIRDWMLWTVGVSLGLRVSDLLSLRIKQLLNPDKTFRKRLFVIEQKTTKLNDCLITESVVMAVTKYLTSINWQFDFDDYLFRSSKTGGKMGEEHGWRLLSDAGKALHLPIVVGSHTMRKSFANIAACVDTANVDMNAITKIQGLLNHADQRVTMRYLGTYKEMYDRARIAVSDFVLGRTDIHTLTAGNSHSLEDIVDKLDAIDKLLKNKEET